MNQNTFTQIKQRVQSNKTRTVTKAEQAEKQANTSKVENASKLTDEKVYESVSTVQKDITGQTGAIAEKIQNIVQDEQNVELAIEVQTEANAQVQDIIVSAEELNSLKTSQERQISAIKQENKDQTDDLKREVKDEENRSKKEDQDFQERTKSDDDRRKKQRTESEAQSKYEQETEDNRRAAEHKNEVRRETAEIARTDANQKKNFAERDENLKEREGKVSGMEKAIEEQVETLKTGKEKAAAKGAKDAKNDAERIAKLLAAKNVNVKQSLNVRKTILTQEVEKSQKKNEQLTKQFDDAVSEGNNLAKSAVSQNSPSTQTAEKG